MPSEGSSVVPGEVKRGVAGAGESEDPVIQEGDLGPCRREVGLLLLRGAEIGHTEGGFVDHVTVGEGDGRRAHEVEGLEDVVAREVGEILRGEPRR